MIIAAFLCRLQQSYTNQTVHSNLVDSKINLYLGRYFCKISTMKRTLFLSIFSLLLGATWFFLSSNTDGVLSVYYSGGPANSGIDRTGSPFSGGQTCNACHSGGSGSTTISFALKNASNATVTSYLPGVSYTAEFTVTSNLVIKGFQAVALRSGNLQAGNFTAALTTQSVISSLGGKQYPEHQGSSGTGIFKFTWVAPAAGSGNVTFYACGNGVNGNGGTTGDLPSSPITAVISEAIPTSINYGSTQICNNGFNLTPTITGTQGGTFSVAPAGLVLNPTTGQLNTAASSPGQYTITYTFAGGTATKPMKINPTYNINNTATICSNDSIFLGGAWQNTPGTYTSNLTSISNCDSIVNTTLSVTPASSSQTSVSICQGDSVLIYGQYQSTPGDYVQVLQNSQGCDSIITTQLSTNPVFSTVTFLTICAGESVQFGGNTITQAGTYSVPGQTVNGCDSTQTLQLSVTSVNVAVSNASPNLSAQQSGATYQWVDCNNNFAPIAGATSQTFTATANGSYAVIVTDQNCSDTSVCQTVANVGLGEYAFGETVLYPNPSNGQLGLSFSQKTDAQVNLLDLNGKLLFTDRVVGQTAYHHPLNVAPGTYLVQLQNETGSVQMLWVVK